MTGSFMSRGNQHIQLVNVLYYKLPTIGKQLPTFPHSVRDLNHRPQRWEASVLPLYKGPQLLPVNLVQSALQLALQPLVEVLLNTVLQLNLFKTVCFSNTFALQLASVFLSFWKPGGYPTIFCHTTILHK